MYLNKTHQFGGRNVRICPKKPDVFRREKGYLSVKFGSCQSNSVAVGKI